MWFRPCIPQATNRARRTPEVHHLNAGVQAAVPVSYSTDGYEETFATNCLRHLLPVNLLRIAVLPDGRIVLTSGTRDPAPWTANRLRRVSSPIPGRWPTMESTASRSPAVATTQCRSCASSCLTMPSALAQAGHSDARRTLRCPKPLTRTSAR
jgi:hypothetical protein